MSEGHAPNRRRFRWSLRTLFVVVTLFSVWLGWSLNWIHQRHLAAIEFDFDSTVVDDPYPAIDPFSFVIRGRAPWQLWLFGEQGYSEIVLAPHMRPVMPTIEDRDRIRKIFPEAKVELQLSDDKH